MRNEKEIEAEENKACESLDRFKEFYPEFNSVNKILNRYPILPDGEDKFVHHFADRLVGGSREARQIYRTAANISEKAALIWANIKDAIAPYYNQVIFNNLPDSFLNKLRSIPAYDRLFGSLDYINCDHCRSIFGPGAYYADLMRFVDIYITGGNAGIPSNCALGYRRPDLYKIRLDCRNSTDLVPSIDLVNELLESFLETTGNKNFQDAYRMAAYSVFPQSLPFNLPLEQIRNYLQQYEIRLDQIYRAFAKPFIVDSFHDEMNGNIAREFLELSPEDFRLLTSKSSSPQDVPKYYGGVTLTGRDGLENVDILLETAKLTHKELNELISLNLDGHEINAGLSRLFFINGTEDGLGPLAISRDEGLGYDKLQNLSPGKLDRLYRFLKLSRKLGWSFADLDWSIRSLCMPYTPEKALKFDGIDDYVFCQNASQLDILAFPEFTIESWIIADSPGYNVILGMLSTRTAKQFHISFGLNPSNKLVFCIMLLVEGSNGIARSEKIFEIESNDSIALGIFTHIAVTRKDNKISLFINGKKDVEQTYVFSWDKIPGKDNGRLVEFLTQKFGIYWVKTAKVEKIDDDKTIKVSTEKNSLSLKLNDKKTEVILKIDDVRTNKFIAKLENDELNIYKNTYPGPIEVSDPIGIDMNLGRDIFDKYFHGIIKEVRIWKIAHDEAAIYENRYHRFTGKERNLIGYWPLTESLSDYLPDLSQSSAHGILGGGEFSAEPIWVYRDLILDPLPEWNEGKFLQFNGLDQYLAGKLTFDKTSHITIEACIKIEEPRPDDYIFCMGDESQKPKLALWCDAQGKLNFKAGSMLDSIKSSIIIPLNTNIKPVDTHVCIVLNDTNAQFYINGKPESLIKIGSPLNMGLNNGDLLIGRSFDKKYFRGQIKEVRIWGLARTEDEINSFIYRPVPASSSGLIGYWRMDEIIMGMAQDLTYLNNHLYLGGLPKDYRPSPVTTESLPLPESLPVPASGTVLQFDGDNDVIVIKNPKNWGLGRYERLTLGLWFLASTNSDPNRKQVLFAQGDAEAGLNVYLYQGLIHVLEWNNSFENATQGILPLNRSIFKKPLTDYGHWHHIALTHNEFPHPVAADAKFPVDDCFYKEDNIEFRAYLDGTPLVNVSGNQASLGFKLSQVGVAYLGGLGKKGKICFDDAYSDLDHLYFFAGQIADLGIWNAIKSPEEISRGRYFAPAITEDLITYMPMEKVLMDKGKGWIVEGWEEKNRHVGTLQDRNIALVSEKSDPELVNIYSHYQNPPALLWKNYFYSGRMCITEENASVGITFLSRHPEGIDQCYLLGRDAGHKSFHLFAHPSGVQKIKSLDPAIDKSNSGVEPQLNVWYRFLINVEDTGTRTNIHAKIWPENELMPLAYQIEAYDDSSIRIVSGTVGVWTTGSSASKRQYDNLRLWPNTILDPSPSDLLLDINFEAESQVPEPDNWLDAQDLQKLPVEEGLFKQIAVLGGAVGETAFGTDCADVNIHSYYHQIDANIDPLNWNNYVYRGRVRITHADAGLGVVFLSRQPDGIDQYYGIVRDKFSRTFHLTAHPKGIQTVKSTDPGKDKRYSGIEPLPNVWYCFLIEVLDTGARTNIRVKIWPESESICAEYSIDAYDDSDIRIISGTVGVWASGTGSKYYKDLRVYREMLFSENFDAYSVNQDPLNWRDTKENGSNDEDNSLFKTFALEGRKVFGTISPSNFIHSHYGDSRALNWKNYTYSGRMRIDDSGPSLGGMGITFLSQFIKGQANYARYYAILYYPYYTLKHYPEDKSKHGFFASPYPLPLDKNIPLKGNFFSGIIPKANTWYRFLINVQDTGTQTIIRAKIWPQSEIEPAGYHIEAYDDRSDRLKCGTVGVETHAAGSKYFDDLEVVGEKILSEQTLQESWHDVTMRIYQNDDSVEGLFKTVDLLDNAPHWVVIPNSENNYYYPVLLRPLSLSALKFDGQCEYISAKGYEKTLPVRFTLEAWISPSELVESSIISITGKNTGGNGITIVFGMDGSGNLQLLQKRHGEECQKAFSSGKILNVGKFCHVALAVTNNGTNPFTFFINGESLKSSGSLSQLDTLNLKVDRFDIGKGIGSDYFPGKIKEVRIWNRSRSLQDLLLQMYQKPASDDLINYWSLGEDERDEVRDLSGNNQNMRQNMRLGGLAEDRHPILTDPQILGFWRPQRKALAFNGISDILKLTYDSGNIIKRRTVELLFCVEDKKPSRQKQVIYQEGDDKCGLSIYVCGGSLYFGGYNLTENRWQGTWLHSNRIESGRWHHASLVLDGRDEVRDASIQAYLDGKRIGEGQASRLQGQSVSLSLGGRGSRIKFHDGDGSDISGDYFRGQILSLRIWNSNRSAEQIRNNTSTSCPDGIPSADKINLDLGWESDYADPSAHIIKDQSGKGRTAEYVEGQLQPIKLPAKYALPVLSLDASAIEGIAEIKRLSEQYRQPIDRLTALWYGIKHYGNDGSTTLFDRIFNPKGTVNERWDYYLDEPMRWDKSGKEDRKRDSQIRSRLMGALRVSHEDLNLIVEYLSGKDENIIELDSDYLARLYRLSQLAGMLHIAARDLIQMLKMLGRDTPNCLQDVLDIRDLAEWMKSSGLDVEDLIFLAHNKNDPDSANITKYRDQDIRSLAERLLGQSANFLINSKSFLSDHLGEAESKVTFDFLQNLGIINIIGAVTPRNSEDVDIKDLLQELAEKDNWSVTFDALQAEFDRIRAGLGADIMSKLRSHGFINEFCLVLEKPNGYGRDSLMTIFDGQIPPETHVFSWEKIPGKDNEILIESLTKKFGVDWVKAAKIEKIDSGKTIKVSTDRKSLSLELNDEKTEVILKIDYIETDKFIAKMENDELNIYKNPILDMLPRLTEILEQRAEIQAQIISENGPVRTILRSSMEGLENALFSELASLFQVKIEMIITIFEYLCEKENVDCSRLLLDLKDLLKSESHLSTDLKKCLFKICKLIYLADAFDLTTLEMAALLSDPERFNLADCLHLSWQDLDKLYKFKQFQSAFGDTEGELIDLLGLAFDNKAAIEAKLDDLAGWEPNELRSLITHFACAFSWDEVPGKDNGRLIEFLIKKFGIGWAETAKIEKIDDGKTIKVYVEENSISLKLNNEKTEAILKIDDAVTYRFIAKMENDELNIYEVTSYNNIPGLSRLKACFDIAKAMQAGIDLPIKLSDTALLGTSDEYDFYSRQAQGLQEVLRAGYTDEEWQNIYRPIHDRLAVKSRDALLDLALLKLPEYWHEYLFCWDNIPGTDSGDDSDQLRMFLGRDLHLDWVESADIKKMYLFSWDKIPGKDNEILIDFLTKKFGIDWLKTAKIEKIDDGKIIKASIERNCLSLELNDEKTKVILKIDDIKTDTFIAKMENNELNRYFGKIIKVYTGFSWDKIPGKDNEILIEYLTKKFGIDWLKTAKIEKIDDGKTIKASIERNYLSLELNDEKTKVILKIDDIETDKFIAKMENEELNVYDDFATINLVDATPGTDQGSATLTTSNGQKWELITKLENGKLNIYQQKMFRKGPDIYHEYFLLDLQVGPEVETSRIVQATAALQFYVQRCLLNLEAGVNPSTIPLQEWDWVKNYRVWEANRKVFLYPENYIEPELRDSKTPFFEDLEQELLQSDISQESVESAYIHYLEKFAEVANLKISGSYLHVDLEDDGHPETLYLVGRTNTEPKIFYLRKRIKDGKGERWLPWKKIDLVINSDFVTPVYAFGKLFLFWTEFTKLKKGVGDKGESVDFYKPAVKYSYFNFSQEWKPPQSWTELEKVELSEAEHQQIRWQRLYAQRVMDITLPDNSSQLEVEKDAMVLQIDESTHLVKTVSTFDMNNLTWEFWVKFINANPSGWSAPKTATCSEEDEKAALVRSCILIDYDNGKFKVEAKNKITKIPGYQERVDASTYIAVKTQAALNEISVGNFSAGSGHEDEARSKALVFENHEGIASLALAAKDSSDIAAQKASLAQAARAAADVAWAKYDESGISEAERQSRLDIFNALNATALAAEQEAALAWADAKSRANEANNKAIEARDVELAKPKWTSTAVIVSSKAWNHPPLDIELVFNNWQHIAITLQKTGTGYDLWANNLDKVALTEQNVLPTGDKIVIGSQEANVRDAFVAQMSEIRLWDHIRDKAIIEGEKGERKRKETGLFCLPLNVIEAGTRMNLIKSAGFDFIIPAAFNGNVLPRIANRERLLLFYGERIASLRNNLKDQSFQLSIDLRTDQNIYDVCLKAEANTALSPKAFLMLTETKGLSLKDYAQGVDNEVKTKPASLAGNYLVRNLEIKESYLADVGNQHGWYIANLGDEEFLVKMLPSIQGQPVAIPTTEELLKAKYDNANNQIGEPQVISVYLRLEDISSLVVPSLLQNTFSLGSDQINVVAISSNGARAGYISGYGKLMTQNMPGQSLPTALADGSYRTTAVAMTPDCRYAVSVESSQWNWMFWDTTFFRIRDMENADNNRDLEIHYPSSDDPISLLALTTDCSKAVSISGYGTARLWDLADGQSPLAESHIYQQINAVAVAIKKSQIIVVLGLENGMLKVWDPLNESILDLKGRHNGPVNAVAITSDGSKAISASADKTLKLWDLGTGSILRTLGEHTDEVVAVAMTPDGTRAISGSLDGQVKAWNLESGLFLRDMQGHTGSVSALAVTSDFTRGVSVSKDGILKVWNLTGFDVHNIKFSFERLSTFAVHKLSENLFIGGIDELLSLESQKTNELNFREEYDPNPELLPQEYNDIKTQIDFKGAHRLYYEEIFFHIPFLIANKLSSNQRFEEAQKWYHYIFNPMANDEATGNESGKDRYWRYLPFREDRFQSLKTLLTDGEALAAYREDPFDPHAIAALRMTAYKKAVVMKYIDNLLDGGDSLFMQDTRESVNEAAGLYVLAFNLLGPRPKVKTIKRFEEIGTYDDFILDYQKDSEFMTQVEKNVSGSCGAAVQSPHRNIITDFCVPENEKFIGYWDLVEDRLFKIRHSQNFEGVFRQLALFSPPINPTELVAAMASGGGISGALSDLNVAVPHYRYPVVVAMAKEMTSNVISLGSSLLDAIEKQNAEQLANLQNTHERDILKLMETIKVNEVEQAGKEIDALKESKTRIELKKSNFDTLINGGISPGENAEIILKFISGGLKASQIAVEILKGISESVPGITVGLMGPIPYSETERDAHNWGAIFEAVGGTIECLSDSLDHFGEASGKIAEYKRRKEEWEFEKGQAESEANEIGIQIMAAEKHLDSVKMELKIHETTMEQNRQIEYFYRSKFSNEKLYNWMAGRLSSLYFRAYKTAYDLAKSAEKALQYELPSADTYITPVNWDGLRKGILAGESLMLQIDQMEKSHLAQDSRFLEMEKTISMKNTYPGSLLLLMIKGACEFQFKEEIFDRDYPGHYFRVIKTIELTVVTQRQLEPYQSVNVTLVQLGNKTLLTPDVAAVSYLMGKDSSSDQPYSKTLRVNWRANQQVAVSRVNERDAGMFYMDFMFDNRYFPFEGTGAVSSWRLEIPLANNPDLVANNVLDIDDVMIHIRYTAKSERGQFKTEVEKLLQQ